MKVLNWGYVSDVFVNTANNPTWGNYGNLVKRQAIDCFSGSFKRKRK